MLVPKVRLHLREYLEDKLFPDGIVTEDKIRKHIIDFYRDKGYDEIKSEFGRLGFVHRHYPNASFGSIIVDFSYSDQGRISNLKVQQGKLPRTDQTESLHPVGDIS